MCEIYVRFPLQCSNRTKHHLGCKHPQRVFLVRVQGKLEGLVPT